MSTIESIGAASGSASRPLGGPVENPGAILDRDAFLKLLVAQLKYQDPTKPADTSQMVAQSAQLTMVDRLNDIATALEDATATDRLAVAGSMVGRDVTFFDQQGSTITARVESVRFDGDLLTLMAGGYAVPLAAVIEVFAPAPAPVDPVPTPPALTP